MSKRPNRARAEAAENRVMKLSRLGMIFVLGYIYSRIAKTGNADINDLEIGLTKAEEKGYVNP